MGLQAHILHVHITINRYIVYFLSLSLSPIVPLEGLKEGRWRGVMPRVYAIVGNGAVRKMYLYLDQVDVGVLSSTLDHQSVSAVKCALRCIALHCIALRSVRGRPFPGRLSRSSALDARRLCLCHATIRSSAVRC